jgi:hypothetical protein
VKEENRGMNGLITSRRRPLSFETGAAIVVYPGTVLFEIYIDL